MKSAIHYYNKNGWGFQVYWPNISTRASFGRNPAFNIQLKTCLVVSRDTFAFQVAGFGFGFARDRFFSMAGKSFWEIK